jgi:hypothetical protein
VAVKTAAIPWTLVWEHTGSTIDEGAWSLQSHDISTWADGKAAVGLRWSMGPTNATGTLAGWNLDDIRVYGVVHAPCSAAPGEAPNLRFGADKQTLSWGLAPFYGGLAPVYDLLRSSARDDFGGATCVGTNLSATFSTDAAVPTPEQVHYYLVRAENACGQGALGPGQVGPACP